MPKLAPYFFKISTNPKDPWYSLGCFHSVEEAYSYFEEHHGKMDVSIVKGKYFEVVDGILYGN